MADTILNYIDCGERGSFTPSDRCAFRNRHLNIVGQRFGNKAREFLKGRFDSYDAHAPA